MTIVSIQPEQVATSPSAARISLKPLKAFTEHPGMVNGAWWPQSRDLAVELPPLVAALDKAWGRINRVTVNLHMWPQIPRKVPTGSHVIRVGWYDAEQDPHDVCLISYSHAPYRWDLLVIPPETDPERAAHLMATASDVHNMQTASALIADAAEPPRDPSPDPVRILIHPAEGTPDRPGIPV